MAKRRHSSADEILLVPFLDILCSLIGVLVLIIVVLCVAESQQTQGRTQEEIQRAQEYKAMLAKQKQDTQLSSVIKEKLALLEKLKQELEPKEQMVAKLRNLLSNAAENKKTNEQQLKELDNLVTEISGFKNQETELKKKLAELAAELKEKQVPLDKQGPQVVVQPGGTGLAKGSKLYFVETSGSRIVIFWDAQKKTQVSSAPAVLIVDTAYEHFLKEVKKDPNAKLVYLIREDGQTAYNSAAGWAMSTYEFKPGQVARLPIPGRGAINLQMFKDYLGTLPPPADAKLLPGDKKG